MAAPVRVEKIDVLHDPNGLDITAYPDGLRIASGTGAKAFLTWSQLLGLRMAVEVS